MGRLDNLRRMRSRQLSSSSLNQAYSEINVLRPAATLLSLFIVAPLVVYAQNGGSPLDNGFAAIQI